MTRAPFQKGHDVAKQRLGRLHSDVCGPMETTSLGKRRYFCVLVDDRTGYTWFHPCALKSDFTSWFVRMDKIFANHYGTHTKVLRSDRGGEYVNTSLEDYCADNGIKIELTVPYTPEQNGVAERMNRKILDKGRTIMKDVEAPDFLWADAFATVTYALNRTVSTRAGGRTPYEAFFGRKPDVSHMRVWFSNVFTHQPKDLGARKLGERGHPAKFLGYPENSAGYKTYDPASHKVEIVRAPIFREEARPRPNAVFEMPVDDSDDDHPGHTSDTVPSGADTSPDVPGVPQDPPVLLPIHQDRPMRARHAPPRFDPDAFGPHGRRKEAIANAYEDLINGVTPAPNLADLDDLVLDHTHLANTIDQSSLELPDAPSFREAMAGPEHDRWHAAILEELAAIKEAGTWELVDYSPALIQNVIGCRFILQKKRGPDGEVLRYKARLVAQGFSQQEGIDYSETFAPVVKSASLRVFLAICAHLGWKIRQMDIKSAYLNGSLSEEIYMRQPKGYEEKGSENKVAKLKKGLYGLKQAGRVWYATLHDYLVKLGFRCTHADHSVFVFERGQSLIIIPVYVDDKLLAGNDKQLLDAIQHAIGARFKSTDLGMAAWILGIRVHHDIEAGTLFIEQSQYIKGILSRYKMTGCTPVSTPLPANTQFQPAPADEHAGVSSYPYLEAIGSLMYAAMGTRPDISYAVRSLTPFASNFGQAHINGVKHVLRYLSGCPDRGILYTRDGGGLVGYTDADWASDRSNRRSISGYAFLLSGGAVSWMSKQQSTVASSSTHAEYIAAAEASKELVWLRRLLSELRKGTSEPTPLHIDNRAADLLARNPVNHGATKHIDVRYHFIRECIADRSIDLKLIGTNDMAADLLTKSLARVKHERFCRMLGMETLG